MALNLSSLIEALAEFGGCGGRSLQLKEYVGAQLENPVTYPVNSPFFFGLYYSRHSNRQKYLEMRKRSAMQGRRAETQ